MLKFKKAMGQSQQDDCSTISVVCIMQTWIDIEEASLLSYRLFFISTS
jgi:hypothetical protein